MTTVSSVQALAHVLREGRLFLGESPEQVGGSLNISGRAIRRLEECETGKPRDLTLTTLSSYYNLDAEFIRWLARLDASGDELTTRLAHRAELAGLQPVEVEPLELAMMLARHRPTRGPGRGASELEQLQAEVALLNGRRRQLVQQFVSELRLAQSEEVRRREDAA